MVNNRISMAVCAAVLAVAIGGTVAGCNKSGGGGTASSSASSSSSTSAPTSTPAGKAEKSPDGKFTVVLPESLEIMPTDSSDKEPGLFAVGKADDTMFIAGVITGDDRGNTPRESLEKGGKGFADEWKGTFDPANIKPATLDGEPAWQSSLSFPGTAERPGDRSGQILCVQRGDTQYGLFYATASPSFEADFEAIKSSWKWT
jgi:hypothetical protein